MEMPEGWINEYEYYRSLLRNSVHQHYDSPTINRKIFMLDLLKETAEALYKLRHGSGFRGEYFESDADYADEILEKWNNWK